jgi:hypothetical protein
MLPERRQSRTVQLQADLSQAVNDFMETGKSRIWSFRQ